MSEMCRDLPLRRPENAEGWKLRPRHGRPRCVIEVIVQWVWRWRVEIMLAYLIAATTATIAWWLIH
jgi:hypothetical protein